MSVNDFVFPHDASDYKIRTISLRNKTNRIIFQCQCVAFLVQQQKPVRLHEEILSNFKQHFGLCIILR